MTGEAGPPNAPPSLGSSTVDPLDSYQSSAPRGKWVWGVLLVLVLLLLLLALSLAHVTAGGPAKRSLRQSIAILTEIDAFLDGHWETLREDAERAQGANEQVSLPDFPVQVTFAPEQVLELDREAFRALLLDQSAVRVYEEGVSALQKGQSTDVGFFSLQGALQNGINFQRSTPHNALTVATVMLAALAAALALTLARASQGYGRLLALGVSVLLAALLFLILAMAMRYALRLAADGADDYLARELLVLGEELAWAPIRNGIIFSAGGGVLVALGATLALWSNRTLPRPATT